MGKDTTASHTNDLSTSPEENKAKHTAQGTMPKHRGRLLHSYVFPGRLVPASNRYYDIEFLNGDLRARLPEENVRRPEEASRMGSVKQTTPGTPSRTQLGQPPSTATLSPAGVEVDVVGRLREGDEVEALYEGVDEGRGAAAAGKCVVWEGWRGKGERTSTSHPNGPNPHPPPATHPLPPTLHPSLGTVPGGFASAI